MVAPVQSAQLSLPVPLVAPAPSSAADSRRVVYLGRLRSGVGLCLVVAAIGTSLWFWRRPVSSGSDIAADAAIVSAPVPGGVGALPEVGCFVNVGDIVAEVRNERVDVSRLLGLQQNLAVLLARRASASSEMESLMRELIRERRSASSHAEALSADLSYRAVEADAGIAAAKAIREQVATDVRAAEALFEQGLVARTYLEKLRASVAAADAAVHTQDAVADRARAARDSQRSGIVISTSDAAFQEARVDDLALRLASLESSSTALNQEIEAARDAVRSEEAQVAQARFVVVRSAVRGRVWKRLATPGSYVSAGAPLVEIVDDASTRVEAYFHQAYLRHIQIGARAVVTPIGSNERYAATVSTITADVLGTAPLVEPRRPPRSDGAMRVVLTLDDEVRRQLFIGERVTVTLPSRSLLVHQVDGLLTRLF